MVKRFFQSALTHPPRPNPKWLGWVTDKGAIALSEHHEGKTKRKNPRGQKSEGAPWKERPAYGAWAYGGDANFRAFPPGRKHFPSCDFREFRSTIAKTLYFRLGGGFLRV